MKLSKLGLAVASIIGAGIGADAMALDLYVDSKTQQIFAEPGKGRVKLGSFERVEDTNSGKAALEAQKAEIEQIKEDLALKNNELKALDEHVKSVEEVKVKADKKGLQIESADGNFKFKVSGRLQADANFHDSDLYYPSAGGVANTSKPTYANDGTELRRARLRFNGTLYKDWDFIFEGDFAKNGVSIKDAFMEYKGFDKIGTIVLGHQKQLFSNELWASSNDILFMERSLMNVLNNPTAERAIGASFQSHGEDWYAGIGVFGDSIGVNTSTTSSNHIGVTEGWGTSARATWAPINEKDRMIHLGLAGNYRKTDTTHGTLGNSALSYKYQTTNMSGLNLLNYSTNDVQDIRQIGLELGGMYGPWSILGEYTSNWMDTTSTTTPSFNYDGYYIETAYSLTGESRKYAAEEGKFKRLKPKNNFSPANGNWGAFELAARYAAVNMNDEDRQNGALTNMSIGLNWYMNENIRFMADFTKSLSLKNGAMVPASGDTSDLDVYQFRGQWAF